MAWVDITVGAIIGLLIAFAFSRVFIIYPKTTAIIVFSFAVFGLTLSDDFLTPNDKRWNIVDKIKNFFEKNSQNNL